MRAVPRRRFLWITDPWETLDHPSDTTLRWARAAHALGHAGAWADFRTLRAEGSRVRLDARRIRALDAAAVGGLSLAPARVVDPAAFDRVLFRPDPPVDLGYLHALQVLALAGARVINPIELLLTANEKLVALDLPALAPPGLVSAEPARLREWISREGDAVLKPLHLAQSKGIHRVRGGDPAERLVRLTAEATGDGTRPALVQRYLPGIDRGETRLWFVDGRLLAHARKLPLDGDFRVDLDRGSRVTAEPLSARDRRAVPIIARWLRRRGARLAAFDLIDGRLTDANFTSPGMIVQMEQVLGADLATPTIRALARG